MAETQAAPDATSAPPTGAPPKIDSLENATKAMRAYLDSEGAPEDAAPPTPKATLEGAEAPAEPEQPEGDEPTPKLKAKAEKAEGDDAHADTEEAKPEPQGEGEESSADIPDTFQGLASQLGVDPADLAAHLKVQIKGPDGRVTETITFAEAVRGHLREADYTQKTQAIAEQRKAIEAFALQANQALQAKFQQLDGLINGLQGELDNGITEQQLTALLDPNSSTYNPEEYLRQRATREHKAATIKKAAEARDAERAQAEETNRQRLGAHIQDQRARLVAAMPELRDAKTSAQWMNEIGEYLTNGAGFAFEEVAAYANSAWDHRYWVLADKARKYDALQKGRSQMTKAIGNKPPVLKGGAVKGGKSSPGEDLKPLQSRLRKTGAFGDAQKLVHAAMVKGIL